MKRHLKIALFLLLTIMLLSSGFTGKKIRSEPYLISSLVTKDDTTNFVNLIKVDFFKLSIIPPSSGIQFYKDRIIFLSMSKYERKMSPNQISFGAVEAYYASIEDTTTGRHMIFSPLSSFSYPCEAMTFSRDYNTIYFTKISKKDRKEKIYMGKLIPNSTNQTGVATELIPLDFCADNFNYSHPALSSDESMMIFASDREGSLGGMDLFISRKVGNKWSSPENLGELINTPGNEFFPFLDSENNLFFSSDRLPGFGGYDIFTCKYNGSGWDKPVNLSGRINSDKDDIAFTINKSDGKTAFFTRRQRSARAEMQLFRVTLKQEVTGKNLLTISDIFNRKPVSTTGIKTAGITSEIKPAVSEPGKPKPDTIVIKKDKVKVPATTSAKKKMDEKSSATKAENKAVTTDNKAVMTKPTGPTPIEQKAAVIYRVQLLPGESQKNAKEIVMNGSRYKLYEYQYLGVKRYAIGEFSTLASAVVLQRTCRQSGYAQSFVIAFKNNVRSLDPELFK